MKRKMDTDLPSTSRMQHCRPMYFIDLSDMATQHQAVIGSAFSGVPEDVMEYIMLHLTQYGDLQSCSLTCKLWHRLANRVMLRQQTLFQRCINFDWYLLQLPIEMQSPTNKKFTTNIPERCSHSAVYHPQRRCMYVFGGCTAQYTMFNDLLCFDLVMRSWTRPLPTGTHPTPKACASMVRCGDKLILYGGWTKSSPNPIHQTTMFFNEVNIYDPATNTWSLVHDDGTAPHLAGHSACMLSDSNRMAVFGGSFGNGSSNHVWLFDMRKRIWQLAPVAAASPRPAARYGQTQTLIDPEHLLIVGGCGGPNMIYSDAWILYMPCNGQWMWRELRITNAHMMAPAMWSHSGAHVGQNLVVLSKPIYRSLSRTPSVSPSVNRRLNSNHAANSANELDEPSSSNATYGTSNGNLTPPRRKLLTSRSLDEHEPPPSPAALDRKTSELHRARSIPAIIVGQIPTLVVTKDENMSTCVGTSEHEQSSSIHLSPSVISMTESSLLPNQATLVREPIVQHNPHHAPPNTMRVRPNAQADRGRQLEILHKAEEYIRQKRRQEREALAGQASTSSPRFRPRSPPPRDDVHEGEDTEDTPSNKRRSSTTSDTGSVSPNARPMNVYVMDLSLAISHNTVSWRIVESPPDALEDTILYSLVAARGELILFGGMRTRQAHEQAQLHATPSGQHTISNETYILRPVIDM